MYFCRQAGSLKKSFMATTKWTIDNVHSEIHFKVRHMMVSWVTGSFSRFNAEAVMEDEDISTATVRLTADISSISTNNEQRDAHLRAGDFFDAENHPQLIFESRKLEKIDEENFNIHGTLTMRGVSKEIILKGEFGGVAQDSWGNTRIGVGISGKINRKDFGVSFSMVSETGGILLGEEVTIIAHTQFIRQAVAENVAA
jgi:polyisoprenoid-binding protein YceI